MSPTLAVIIGVCTAIIPLVASASLLRSRIANPSTELARLFFMTSLSLLCLLAGPWAWLSYWLRPLAAFVLVAGIIASGRRLVRKAPARATDRRLTVAMAVGGLAVLALNIDAIGGAFPSDDAISLEFPLRDRTFVVLQGGSSFVVNPFHSYTGGAGRLSFDIAALGPLGNRASRLLPSRVTDYYVFGAPVTSACEGVVAVSVDGLPDNAPGVADKASPSGNHVLLQCDGHDDVSVLLAHLRMGSVRTRPRARVSAGEVIAAVGNSGNSSEPHLHVQATRGDVRGGTPVSMLFEDRFLTANELVFGK